MNNCNITLYEIEKQQIKLLRFSFPSFTVNLEVGFDDNTNNTILYHDVMY